MLQVRQLCGPNSWFVNQLRSTTLRLSGNFVDKLLICGNQFIFHLYRNTPRNLVSVFDMVYLITECKKIISSANKIVSSSFNTFVRSLMQRIQSNGYSMDPCASMM